MDLKSSANKTPTVSVVIATYNRGGLLKETVESVLNQTFDDFELIVVDDGSTDDTEEVLKSYGDRLRYLRQENRGTSAARNLGIRHARGRWIAIQDSDDIWTPDHLKVLFTYVDENPGYAMVFGNEAYVGEPLRHGHTLITKEKSRRLVEEGIKLVDLFDTSIVRLQAALISKECLESIGGMDETLRICMDLDLGFRLFMRYRIAYLDQVVYLYRRHEGNIGRDDELRQLENIRVLEKLLREFPESAEILGPKRIARRTAYRYYRLAKRRWKAGKKDEAREALRQAVSLRPFFLKYRFYHLLWA